MNSDDLFEQVVRDHYQALFKFAMSLSRSECDAKDLTQHTFYLWARKGHQLRDVSKVKSWLFTTLHRAFLLLRRKQGRFPTHGLEDSEQELASIAPEAADQIDSSQVLAALGQVGESYRGAVALFYLNQLSYKEIANVLQVPAGTVKSRIARGIAQLRSILLSDGSATWTARKPEPCGTPESHQAVSDDPNIVARGHEHSFGSPRPVAELLRNVYKNGLSYEFSFS